MNRMNRVSKPSVVILSLVLIGAVFVPLVLQAAGGNEDAEPESLYKKGVNRTEAGKYDEAIKLFERSIEQGKNVADSYNMLGYVRRNQGNVREAIQAYYEALDRRSDFPEAREYLGEAYLQGVRQQLEEIRGSAGPDSEAFRELRGVLLELADRYRKDK